MFTAPAQRVTAAVAEWEAAAPGRMTKMQMSALLQEIGLSISQSQLDGILLESGSLLDGTPGQVDCHKFLAFVVGESLERRGDAAPENSRSPAAQKRLRELDNNSSTLFEEMGQKLVRTLKHEFNCRVQAECEDLKERYHDAIRKARASSTKQSDAFMARLRAQSDEGYATSDFGEAVCKLKDQLSTSLSSFLSCTNHQKILHYEGTVVAGLKSIVEDAKRLEEHVTSCLERMSLTLQPRCLDGSSYSVQVCPVVDTVSVMGRKIKQQNGLPSRHHFKFVLDSGPVSMRHGDLLMDHDLTSGILAVSQQDPIQEPLLHMHFRSLDDLSRDIVSGRSLEVEGRVTLFEEDGRRGVRLEPRARFRLPEPIRLDKEWTISVWTLPSDFSHGYQVLLDGEEAESMIMLTLHANTVGFYFNMDLGGRPQTVACNLQSLGAGWHHLAAVGAGTAVSYYLDGNLLGEVQCPRMSGAVHCIGNNSGSAHGEAFKVMSELCIFGTAATKDEVRMLMEEDAPTPRGPLSQLSPARSSSRGSSASAAS